MIHKIITIATLTTITTITMIHKIITIATLTTITTLYTVTKITTITLTYRTKRRHTCSLRYLPTHTLLTTLPYTNFCTACYSLIELIYSIIGTNYWNYMFGHFFVISDY